MDDPMVALLTAIRDLAEGRIVDALPRRESEPNVTLWEMAGRALRDRSDTHPYDPVTGDYRRARHDMTTELVERATALRDRLEARRDERGLLDDMRSIEIMLLEARIFV